MAAKLASLMVGDRRSTGVSSSRRLDSHILAEAWETIALAGLAKSDVWARCTREEEDCARSARKER